MKTKCSCANEHCCHKKVKRKTIFDKKAEENLLGKPVLLPIV
jgi:hypothetical protein